MRALDLDSGVSTGEVKDKMNELQKEVAERKKKLPEKTDSFDWESKIELDNGITKGEMDDLVKRINQEVKEKISKQELEQKDTIASLTKKNALFVYSAQISKQQIPSGTLPKNKYLCL